MDDPEYPHSYNPEWPSVLREVLERIELDLTEILKTIQRMEKRQEEAGGDE